MSKALDQLCQALYNYSPKSTDNSPLNNLSLYRCHLPQKLRAVPFYAPTILLVITGQKRVKTHNSTLTIKPGELMVLPSDTTLWMENHPDKERKIYQGLAFRFEQEALHHFRQIYGKHIDSWDIAPKLHVKSPDCILTILTHWLSWNHHFSPEPQLLQHRQVELLLLLAQAGMAGNILLNNQAQWRLRVSQLLAMDPARSWQIQDICSQLYMSESSLRRKLKDEQTGFREILEEVRLATGLSLLLETSWSVGRIADAAGYQSQSRFGERFKRRFDMTPSELRNTRFNDSGENLKLNGE